MSKGIFSLLLCGLAGLSLLVAGCGSDEETTSLTRVQFIKQGNAICEEQVDKRDAVIGRAIAKVPKGKLMSDAEKKKAMLEMTPVYEEQTEKLKALGIPEGEEQKVEAIVDEMERASKDTRADLDAAIDSNKAYFKANELATDYGLDNCIV